MTETDAALRRLQVFPERCIGAGNCADIAAKFFDQDPDDGTVILLQESVSTEDADLVQEAVSACPVSAITFAEPTQ